MQTAGRARATDGFLTCAMDDGGTRCAYLELNLCQIYDVLRSSAIARLAVAAQDQPYILPVHYQLEVSGSSNILHLSLREGRALHVLRQNPRVCVEMEQATCTGMDTLILHGRAALTPTPGGAQIRVTVEDMTGRRFFRHE